jgi:hypothetical protein
MSEVEPAARVLLVANPSPGHVGAHLLEAAETLNVTVKVCDTQQAFGGVSALRWASWHLRGRRPPLLRRFSQDVVLACEDFGPHLVLATGNAPVDRRALGRLRDRGVRLINYSCDDPWGPHRAGWFLEGLPAYDTIYSPRRANADDFKAAGCADVRYLPFAFSPTLHQPAHLTPEEAERFACDAAFVGSADDERLPLMAALAGQGVRLNLYGRYWDRYGETRPFAQGTIPGDQVAKAIAGAKVAPCLLRRSNRDGHTMRTYELAAMGACMVVEDSAEHRDLFGPDGEAVRYFGSEPELADAVLALLGNDQSRQTLRANVRALMSPTCTYAARLRTMLEPAARQ